MTLQQLKYIIAIADNGSINLAAKALYVSQPSLSGAVDKLEEELGITIFLRNHRGITLTPEGSEFLGYARQITEQYQLMEERYIEKKAGKKTFSVSLQHYTFAVKAFVETAKAFGMDEYELAIHETKTYEVIQNVKNFKSELGVLYLNDFNRRVLEKLFHENELEFQELFLCSIFVYLWKGHPLADREKISMEELEEYPCIAFDQGLNNSFYLSEEVLSTYEYKRMIRVDDRATNLNLMVGLNGYTLCSGIICEDLNGNNYRAIRLDSDEVMHIGYIRRKNAMLSPLAQKYIEEMGKYREKVL